MSASKSSKSDNPDNGSDSVSISSESNKARVDEKVAGVILKEAELVSARGNVVTKDGVVISTQESDVSLAGNIFLDPEVRDYYVGVYEKAKYECRHEFDAELTWTKEEEKKLVRKLDLRGMFQCLRVSATSANK